MCNKIDSFLLINYDTSILYDRSNWLNSPAVIVIDQKSLFSVVFQRYQGRTASRSRQPNTVDKSCSNITKSSALWCRIKPELQGINCWQKIITSEPGKQPHTANSKFSMQATLESTRHLWRVSQITRTAQQPMKQTKYTHLLYQIIFTLLDLRISKAYRHSFIMHLE